MSIATATPLNAAGCFGRLGLARSAAWASATHFSCSAAAFLASAAQSSGACSSAVSDDNLPQSAPQREPAPRAAAFSCCLDDD